MSRFRRLLSRPSSRLVRSILVPLTVIQVVVTIYVLVLTEQTAKNLSYDRIEGMVQTFAMSEAPTSEVLGRTADWIEADRIWLVSATGRIISSNRAAETDALVDEIWWQDLPTNQRRVRRSREWGDRDYVQVAYHDIERGVWAMIIADTQSKVLLAPARTAALVLLSLVIWLLIAGAVITVVRRTLGRSLDISDLVARRALQGDAASTASLARLRAAASGYGPARLLLQLVERMQERAGRANEAESRFGLAVELLPGLAYLASYDGTLLYAGAVLRQRLGPDSQAGQTLSALSTLAAGIPFDRVHAAAEKSRGRGVTFDNLPVCEADGEHPALRASIRSVLFRGVPAYLAHLEAVDDAGDRADLGGGSCAIEPQLVESAQEIIIAFDAGTRTLVWNGAAESFSGQKKAAVPNLRGAIERLFSSEEAMAAFAGWMDGSPESEPLELECRAHSGDSFKMRWTATELTGDGRTLGGAFFGTIMEKLKDRPPARGGRSLLNRRRRRSSPEAAAPADRVDTSDETAGA
ncbi:MAG: PAS domain-containing protein [Thalassolituus oleivorans]